jgi:hypothetical protein
MTELRRGHPHDISSEGKDAASSDTPSGLRGRREASTPLQGMGKSGEAPQEPFKTLHHPLVSGVPGERLSAGRHEIVTPPDAIHASTKKVVTLPTGDDEFHATVTPPETEPAHPRKIDLRTEPALRTEEVARRRADLLANGFSEEWVDKVSEFRPALFSITTVNDSLEKLAERGFTNPKNMVERLPSVLNYTVENIDGKLAGLTERGFSDPRRMIEIQPRILSFSLENIDGRLSRLEERGFTNPQKLVETNPPILSLSFENIDGKLAGLTERGFSDPRRMIEKHPLILGYSFENIDGKLAGLTERGFSDPQRMIEKYPSTLGFSFENIDGKLAGLAERGFSDPRRMIEKHPLILGYSFENIDGKLAGLTERGFSDPQKLVQTLPTVLNLTLENIDGKLVGLEERGFTNPQKLIQSNPSVLGFAFNNIDRRLRMLDHLKQAYNLTYTSPQLMESMPFLFNTKLDKLFVLARLVRAYKTPSEQIDKAIITKLVFSNLENTLVAYAEKPPEEPIEQLIFRAKDVKKRGLTTNEKKEIIARDIDDEKIKRRYFRGYPQAA